MEDINDNDVDPEGSKVVPRSDQNDHNSEERKSLAPSEFAEDGDGQGLSQPVYQIRPRLNEKFKPLSAKEVIHNVLFDYLSAKTYNAEEAIQWTKDIADTISLKVKELKFRHYKYVVNVVLGHQMGAGLKMGTRCIWDAEADSYAYDNFVNDSIFCVAAVYAVYYY